VKSVEEAYYRLLYIVSVNMHNNLEVYTVSRYMIYMKMAPSAMPPIVSMAPTVPTALPLIPAPDCLASAAASVALGIVEEELEDPDTTARTDDEVADEVEASGAAAAAEPEEEGARAALLTAAEEVEAVETAEAAGARGEAGADEAALVLEAALELGSAAAPRRSAYTIFSYDKAICQESSLEGFAEAAFTLLLELEATQAGEAAAVEDTPAEELNPSEERHESSLLSPTSTFC